MTEPATYPEDAHDELTYLLQRDAAVPLERQRRAALDGKTYFWVESAMAAATQLLSSAYHPVVSLVSKVRADCLRHLAGHPGIDHVDCVPLALRGPAARSSAEALSVESYFLATLYLT